MAKVLLGGGRGRGQGGCSSWPGGARRGQSLQQLAALVSPGPGGPRRRWRWSLGRGCGGGGGCSRGAWAGTSGMTTSLDTAGAGGRGEAALGLGTAGAAVRVGGEFSYLLPNLVEQLLLLAGTLGQADKLARELLNLSLKDVLGGRLLSSPILWGCGSVSGHSATGAPSFPRRLSALLCSDREAVQW